MKDIITYDDFARMDLRVGTIVDCEEVEGSRKLYKLKVDLGELGERIILSGIKSYFKPKELIGVQVLVLANLEPKKMMGWESQGMILMAVEKDDGVEKGVTLLVPQNQVENGIEVE